MSICTTSQVGSKLETPSRAPKAFSHLLARFHQQEHSQTTPISHSQPPPPPWGQVRVGRGL